MPVLVVMVAMLVGDSGLAHISLRQQVQNLCGKVLSPTSPAVTDIAQLVDSDGRTPLHYSAIFGDLDLTRLFLEVGIDPMIKDGDYKYPFDYLVEQASDPQNPNNSTSALIASYVLEKMPSRQPGRRAERGGIYQRDNKGWTPLVWAVAAGNKERVIELLDAGVEVFDKTIDRDPIPQYIFKIAETAGDQEIIDLLVDRLNPKHATLALYEGYNSGVSKELISRLQKKYEASRISKAEAYGAKSPHKPRVTKPPRRYRPPYIPPPVAPYGYPLSEAQQKIYFQNNPSAKKQYLENVAKMNNN